MSTSAIIEEYRIAPNAPSYDAWVGRPGRQTFIAEPRIGDVILDELGNGPRGYLRAAIDERDDILVTRTAAGWSIGFSRARSITRASEARVRDILAAAGVARSAPDQDRERAATIAFAIDRDQLHRHLDKVTICPILNRLVLHAASYGGDDQAEVARIVTESGLPLPIAPNPRRRYVVADYLARVAVPALLDAVDRPAEAARARALPPVTDTATAAVARDALLGADDRLAGVWQRCTVHHAATTIAEAIDHDAPWMDGASYVVKDRDARRALIRRALAA